MKDIIKNKIPFMPNSTIHFEKMIVDVVGDINIEDLKIPFCAVAVDMKSGNEADIKKGRLCKALAGSCAVPGVFEPVEMEDMLLFDGGLQNTIPSDVLRKMGMPADHRFGDAIAEVIEEYKPIAMRGQIYENKGITIIDDTYNASPDSMKSGLSVLWEKNCNGKRIAVLADVLELGEASEQLHRGIGAFIAEKYNEGIKTDILYTVGKEASYIADEAIKNINTDKEDIIIKSFATRDELIECIKGVLCEGDLVMLKGSRGMQMDKVCEVLKEM